MGMAASLHCSSNSCTTFPLSICDFSKTYVFGIREKCLCSPPICTIGCIFKCLVYWFLLLCCLGAMNHAVWKIQEIVLFSWMCPFFFLQGQSQGFQNLPIVCHSKSVGPKQRKLRWTDLHPSGDDLLVWTGKTKFCLWTCFIFIWPENDLVTEAQCGNKTIYDISEWKYKRYSKKTAITATDPFYDASVWKDKAEVDEDWGLVFEAGAEGGWSGDRVLLCLCVWVSFKSAKQLQWRRLILLL